MLDLKNIKNNTPEDVAQWAMKKYGKDALYMLEETGEGEEVFGITKTKKAALIIRNIKKWGLDKIIDGKMYSLCHDKSIYNKSEAERLKEKYKNNGALVRIITAHKKTGNKYYVYICLSDKNASKRRHN